MCRTGIWVLKCKLWIGAEMTSHWPSRQRKDGEGDNHKLKTVYVLSHKWISQNVNCKSDWPGDWPSWQKNGVWVPQGRRQAPIVWRTFASYLNPCLMPTRGRWSKNIGCGRRLWREYSVSDCNWMQFISFKDRDARGGAFCPRGGSRMIIRGAGKSTDSQTKGFLMRLWLVGVVSGQQI